MASATPPTSISDMQQQQNYAQHFALNSPMLTPLDAQSSSNQMVPQYSPQCDQQMYHQQQPPLHLLMPNAMDPRLNGMDPNMGASTSYAHPMVGNLFQQQPMPYIPQSPTSIPSSPSSLAGPIRKRRFSSAKIQPTRIKKVMQSDEEIGRMVASVPVAIGRAMEHFAEKFLLASAAAVTGLNGRTLGPSHMKLAMMANPHFSFLAPLLREVVVTAKQASDAPTSTQQVPPTMQPFGLQDFDPNQMTLAAILGFQPGDHTMMPGSSFASPAPQMLTNTIPPQIHTAPVEKRRISNGKERPDLAPGEKPKRGRPRKVKKEEKLIDDELANVPTERELMPPPAFPIALPRRNGGAPGGIAPKLDNSLGELKPDLPMRSGGNMAAKLAFQRGALQRQNSQDHGDEEKNE